MAKSGPTWRIGDRLSPLEVLRLVVEGVKREWVGVQRSQLQALVAMGEEGVCPACHTQEGKWRGDAGMCLHPYHAWRNGLVQ